MTGGVGSNTVLLGMHITSLCIALRNAQEFHLHGFFFQERLGYPEDVPQSFPLSALTSQYRLAVLDFYRFLLGWGMWGTDLSHTQRHVEETMSKIDGGKPLAADPGSALLAVQKAFPWTM